MPLPLIFMVCTGLGGIKRGFETYIHKLASDLSNEKNLNFRFKVLSAYKNSNHTYHHISLPAVKRNNRWLHKLTKNIHTHFHVEQQTIFPFLLWRIIKEQPAVVYLGEYQLYCYLFKARKLLGQKWNLCLYTGGQAIPGLFNPQKDWVHHITDCYINECQKNGIAASRQFLIPHSIHIPQLLRNLLAPEKLRITTTKAIVLSVGSIDEKVKRMLSFVRALAPYASEVFPVLVGPETPETPLIKEELEFFFGKDYLLAELPHNELAWIYAQSNLMVSCSLKESFGLVLLEAMLQQTPIVCYNWCGAGYVFNSHANFFTSNNVKEIGSKIHELLVEPPDDARRKYVKDRYSWEALGPKYLKMFSQISNPAVP